MYTVRHCWSNPANNTKQQFSSLEAAKIEARRMVSERRGAGVSEIIDSTGRVVARRDWSRGRLDVG